MKEINLRLLFYTVLTSFLFAIFLVLIINLYYVKSSKPANSLEKSPSKPKQVYEIQPTFTPTPGPDYKNLEKEISYIEHFSNGSTNEYSFIVPYPSETYLHDEENKIVYYIHEHKLFSKKFDGEEPTELASIPTLEDEHDIGSIYLVDDILYISHFHFNEGDKKDELYTYNLNTDVLTYVDELAWYPYSNMRYRGNFSGTHLISNIGGDGCGSGGNFYALVGTQVQLITSVGRGCDENPRFVGLSQEDNSILLLDSNTSLIGLHEWGDRYSKLFKINILTKEREEIMDLGKVLDDFTFADFHYDDETRTLLVSEHHKKYFVYIDLNDQSFKEVHIPVPSYVRILEYSRERIMGIADKTVLSYDIQGESLTTLYEGPEYDGGAYVTYYKDKYVTSSSKTLY